MLALLSKPPGGPKTLVLLAAANLVKATVAHKALGQIDLIMDAAEAR